MYVFINTRVPIKNLIDYLEAGDNLDEFLEDFPSVSRKQAMQALALAKRCCSRKPMRILIDECLPKLHEVLQAAIDILLRWSRDLRPLRFPDTVQMEPMILASRCLLTPAA